MQSPETQAPRGQPGHRRIPLRWVLVALLLVAVALTVTLGVQPRIQAREALRKDTANRSAMVVSVIRPKEGDTVREIVLPGNMRA